ncbi:MAG: hypothetical protein LBQ54_04580 [Planctomycetaceae bacterium]|jgi:hypothetical protein|nr:hypothetical protein [Planctomycetaceae bacterium]
MPQNSVIKYASPGYTDKLKKILLFGAVSGLGAFGEKLTADTLRDVVMPAIKVPKPLKETKAPSLKLYPPQPEKKKKDSEVEKKAEPHWWDDPKYDTNTWTGIYNDVKGRTRKGLRERMSEVGKNYAWWGDTIGNLPAAKKKKAA